MPKKNLDRKVITEVDFSQTNKEGCIREMLAAIKLMKEGYNVSKTMFDNRYDLIAEKYPKYIRIQVKNLKLTYKSDPTQPLSINKWEIHAYTNIKGNKKIYTKDEIDVVFAIDIETENFAIIPVEKIPKTGVVRISEQSDRKEYFNSFKALDDLK